MPLPRGFIPIKEAPFAGPSANFIGVLTHVNQPYKSKGDDWALEFTIQDEFSATIACTSSSVTCRIFRRQQDHLPKPGSIGDLVLIRNIQISKWGANIHLVSGARLNTAILFFQSKNVPVPGLSTAYSEGGLLRLPFNGTFAAPGPTTDEQMAIIHLKENAAPFLPTVRQGSTKKALRPTPRNGKRALIQDMTFGKYYDIVGEVVKYFSPGPSTMDLYVTDYTTNQDLFLYEDPEEAEAEDFELTNARKWPGPFGQMTLAVRLWEPHSSYAHNNIREGDIVSLKNVQAKLSQANKLEGALHEDDKFREKILIRKVTYSKQIEEHRARKKAYEDAYELRRANRDLAPNAPKKPSAKISAKKKETKKKMQQLQKELEQEELEKKAEADTIARAGINPHIRASYPEIRLSTVEEIIHNPSLSTKNSKGLEMVLPFVNAKYRTRVRVVDFAPKDVEDFAHCMADPEWNTAPDSSDRRSGSRWEWGFVLLVEDANAPMGTAPERLRLFVNNSAGQGLLKMSASDLRRVYPQRGVMRQLEDKLFILWGNLLELKKDLSPKGIRFPLPPGDPRLQNMPFECCVEEYGSKVPTSDQWPQGWQRMHQPMGTVIMKD